MGDGRPYFGSGKPKKRRDPNAPKAASNAYMIFCKDRRAELKKEHPDLPFGKIGAKLGEVWRNMSADEKKPYEDKAAKDRERYRKQMEEYQNGGSSAAPEESNDSRKRPLEMPPTSEEPNEEADVKRVKKEDEE